MFVGLIFSRFSSFVPVRLSLWVIISMCLLVHSHLKKVHSIDNSLLGNEAATVDKLNFERIDCVWRLSVCLLQSIDQFNLSIHLGKDDGKMKLTSLLHIYAAHLCFTPILLLFCSILSRKIRG